MKKLFLFLCGALLSLGLSAQEEEYYVTVNTFDFLTTTGAENNVDITDQLGGALLKKGDWVIVTVEGYFNEDVRGMNFTAVADNSEAANYWKNLTEWKTKKEGSETPALQLFKASFDFEIIEDAVSTEKIVIRMDPLSDAATVKLRPTASFVEGTTHTVAMPTVKFSADNAENPVNYKAEASFTTEADLAIDDIIKVTIDGTFSQNVDGINFMVFDKDGNEVMPWSSRPFVATAGVKTTGNVFEFTVPKNVTGTEYKLSIFVAGYDATKSLSFLKDGDVEHEPVEVAKKDYTEITLAYNQYATPANYQFIDASIVENVQVGDYVTFSVSGKASAAFSELIAYVRNATTYNAISGQVSVAKNIEADGEVEYSGVIEITSAAEGDCDLVFEIKDEATEGSSIYIGEGEPYVAVELASKSYTNVTMALNEWDGGSNYQYVEEITAPATGFNATDYVTYSIKGVASEAIEGLQVYLMDDKYAAVSEYKIVQENIAKDGTVDVEGKIELTKATEVCKFVIVTTDAKKEGVASITIGEAGSQDAVEEVSAVSFENGVVYSAGQIIVRNVAGQLIATATYSFDTKSLNSGVYFITAPEGTIKIQK